jgi:hypothetical protein
MNVAVLCIQILQYLVFSILESTTSLNTASSVADPGYVSRIRIFLSRIRIFPSWISGPNFFHLGSRILNQKLLIPDPDLDFLPIPDPGSRGQKDTGSRIRIRNTDCFICRPSDSTVSGDARIESNPEFCCDFGISSQTL